MAITILSLLASVAALAAAQAPSMQLKAHPDVMALAKPFDPIMPAYWTGYPHHRRTPYAVSPDGKTGYLAYLDASGTGVHIQHLNPTTMEPKPPLVTIPNVKEAGGLVAHNHGFALLGNEALPTSVADAPPEGTPVPVLYRYKWGQQVWKTFLGGPGVHPDDGLSMSPDLNGDLVWSPESQLYGAYFVVTNYNGWAEGHFGDSIQYVNDAGELQVIEGATSSWGCSHNTGIALEAAAEPPFASVCAEDQGAIWLNTETQGMGSDGVKVSNENVTNGAGGESLGGMSGSYSSLAAFPNSTAYMLTWVSRGSSQLSENAWMGTGYTSSLNRTNGRNVAIAVLDSKASLAAGQAEATSDLSAASGDSQVNWLTDITDGADRSNAHVGAFDDEYAVVSWEAIRDPFCEFIAMGCRGLFEGTFFQLVTAGGEQVGEPIVRKDVTVSGDMVTMGDGRVCWPYVKMDWTLDQPVGYGGSGVEADKMSIACMRLV